MTQPSRIRSFAVFVALLLLPGRAAAQVNVTPTVMATPRGTLIKVNNSPGADHYDPHVSGDLVTYENTGNTSPFSYTVSYFDLVSLTDNQIPNSGTIDILPDVRGSVIAFTRTDSSHAAIFTFDTSSASLTEVAPQPGSTRHLSQIGDQAIAFEDFVSTGTTSDILAYNRQSGTTTHLADYSTLTQSPAISPDGTVIVWEKSTNLNTPGSTWKAVVSNGTWTARQLVSPAGGYQFHPDTDGLGLFLPFHTHDCERCAEG